MSVCPLRCLAVVPQHLLIYFSALRWRFRTLWAAVLAHGFNNTIGLVTFFLVGPIYERALVLERKPPESSQRAIWSLVLEPSADGTTRLLDRHRSEPRPGLAGSLSDAFWLLGTLLMERGMLRGIKARAERL